MRSVLFLSLLGLILAIGLVACGSSNEREPDDAMPERVMTGPGPIPADDLCVAVAEAYCGANMTCCTRAGESYDTFEACRNDQVAKCGNPDIGLLNKTRVEAGEVLFSQGQAGAALERIEAAIASCRPVNIIDEIDQVFQGQTTTGGACSRYSCLAPLVCLGGEIGFRCSDPPTGGEACTSNERCGEDFYCGPEMTCVAKVGAGEDCGDDIECQSGLCASGSCNPTDANTSYCARSTTTIPFTR
ncbi:MAG: hypothetical protein AAGF12_34775 [Myxococcota bacterium]